MQTELTNEIAGDSVHRRIK